MGSEKEVRAKRMVSEVLYVQIHIALTACERPPSLEATTRMNCVRQVGGHNPDEVWKTGHDRTR